MAMTHFIFFISSGKNMWSGPARHFLFDFIYNWFYCEMNRLTVKTIYPKCMQWSLVIEITKNIDAIIELFAKRCHICQEFDITIWIRAVQVQNWIFDLFRCEIVSNELVLSIPWIKKKKLWHFFNTYRDHDNTFIFFVSLLYWSEKKYETLRIV